MRPEPHGPLIRPCRALDEPGLAQESPRVFPFPADLSFVAAEAFVQGCQPFPGLPVERSTGHGVGEDLVRAFRQAQIAECRTEVTSDVRGVRAQLERAEQCCLGTQVVPRVLQGDAVIGGGRAESSGEAVRAETAERPDRRGEQ